MKKQREPLSDRARQKYSEERKAFQGERFDAGYATGTRLLEQGIIPWVQVERIGSYVDAVGLEEEDCTADKLYQALTGDVDSKQKESMEWLNCHLGTAWPHEAMVYGINLAVRDAWIQITRERGA